MKFTVLTLFPEFMESIKNYSVIGRGIANGIISVELKNIRDYSDDRHKKVDDYSYGGGPGMVMKPQPLVDAIEDVREDASHVIYFSPKGSVLTQEKVKELTAYSHLILVNGHYEGIDQRVIDLSIDEEISLGDFVLSGGEVASLALIDAVSRLIPGVLSNEESIEEESHMNSLLEYPQYTRPENFRGHMVPEILLSGDHKKIELYRRHKALEETLKKRPDLLKKANLTEEDIKFLENIK